MIEEPPVSAAVVADVNATIGAEEKVPAVLGVDPHIVEVGMDPFIDAVG